MTIQKLRQTTSIMLLLSAILAGTTAANASGPGDGVFTALKYLWDKAPSKFDDLVTEKEWEFLGGKIDYSSGITSVELEYDIPEFERERPRVSKFRDDPIDYLITAKKEFDSDASCLAYYNALLKNIPLMLAGDDIEISKHDDHVFYKNETDAFYRKMYVKRYLMEDRGKNPRIIVSVRVTFPEK